VLEGPVHRTPWTDAHDRLVASARPTVPEPSAAELEHGWSQIARVIERQRVPRRHRRARIRIGLAAGIGAVVLGTGGLAAAQLYTAHTGKGPVDAEDLRLGGPGEKLAMAAPDYGAVVAEETTDIPFPTSESRALAVRQQVEDAHGAGTDEFVSTGAIRAWVADAALCSWSNQWAAATRSNDEPARAAAIAMIQDAPAWPAVTAIDPEPYSRMETQEVDDGHGGTTTERYRDESQFFYLGALGRAVKGRDPGVVARLLAENNGYCRAGLVPDLPRADPMYPER
jgi:hypothetical protein